MHIPRRCYSARFMNYGLLFPREYNFLSLLTIAFNIYNALRSLFNSLVDTDDLRIMENDVSLAKN